MAKTTNLITTVIVCSILLVQVTATTAVYAQNPNEIQQMQQQQQQAQQLQQQIQQQATQLPQSQQQIQSSFSQGSTQPDRVGIHDNAQQTSGEGANAGGTVTDPTLAQFFPDGTVSSNCFGKVIQDRAQEHLDDPDEGTLGSHVSDPVPEIPGREVPRQGIGNQDQGTPAAHGAFNSQFDEDDLLNAQQNC